MDWSDLPETAGALTRALDLYDWAEARRICGQLVRTTIEASTPCPEADAGRILEALRRKRRFDLVARVAEAFILSGQNAPRVRRHYAQALIDRGLLVAPEGLLNGLASEPLEGDSQVAEAHGLLGRLFKQRYVDAAHPGGRYSRVWLERSLAEYLQTYRVAPGRYYWQGINAVALLHRARRDGLADSHSPDADAIAREILVTLSGADSSSDPFDLATRLEALIALDDTAAAEDAALTYTAHPHADAFEFGSTLRQLEEVWNLSDRTPPGSTILPLLRAARLKAEQGSALFRDAEVDDELQAVGRAHGRLEKNFGSERLSTLRWYQTGLERTRSVARIERLSGRAHGTGWLVDAAEFFPGRGGVLLLTNAHVVDEEGTNGALAPSEAQANFQGLQETLRFAPRVIWSSPPEELDATFLEFDGSPPNASPLPLSRRTPRLTIPEPLIYIMGHPAGRDLEFSLRDNKLLECDDRLLRYRTPTEPGSSGSPVFEEHGWEVVGLHHAGGTYERLDRRPPPYDANEGISIRAIQARTRSSASSTAAIR